MLAWYANLMTKTCNEEKESWFISISNKVDRITLSDLHFASVKEYVTEKETEKKSLI